MPEPTAINDDLKLQFKMKLGELDEKLKKYDPAMGMLLAQIHQQLRSIPELTYMLSEEEIGRIVEANKRVMKIEITASSSKKESIKKMVDSVSADDF